MRRKRPTSAGMARTRPASIVVAICNPGMTANDVVIRMANKELGNSAEGVGFQRIIRIEIAIDISSRRREPTVKAISRALVVFVDDIGEITSVSLDYVTTAVGRTWINDDVFDVDPCLCNY